MCSRNWWKAIVRNSSRPCCIAMNHPCDHGSATQRARHPRRALSRHIHLASLHHRNIRWHRHRRSLPPNLRASHSLFASRAPAHGWPWKHCFASWRITPPVLMQMNNNESIKQAVAADLGIAFISLHAVAEELHSGKLVALPVDELPLQRHWHIVHLSQRVLSPAAEAFRHYILESGEEFLLKHFAPTPETPVVPAVPDKPQRNRKRAARGGALTKAAMR